MGIVRMWYIWVRPIRDTMVAGTLYRMNPDWELYSEFHSTYREIADLTNLLRQLDISLHRLFDPKVNEVQD